MRHTLNMAWLSVQVGQDHLVQYTKRQPVEALTELIWNGLDAEADEVDVTVETASLAADDRLMFQVRRIEVRDNGHGMTPAIAKKSFPSLGDSWKKELNGRTINQRRILHGSQGRGRFYAYALGHRIRWSSVYEVEPGHYQRLVIEGHANRLNGFDIHEPVEANGPSGTTVSIEVEQERQLSALLDEDLPIHIAARLAAHLLGNPDISVRVDGRLVEAASLVEGEPINIPLKDLDSAVLAGAELPVLMIVEWTDEMRTPLGLVLCNSGGASLKEVEDTRIVGPVKVTGYLKWSRFTQSDLVLPELEFTEVVDSAKSLLQEFVHSRTEELTVTIVTTLKQEGSYPYLHEPHGPIQRTERDMYDLLVVTARNVIGTTRQQRAMSAKLLHLALQERPEALDQILRETLRLSDDQREQLAEMLRYSTLGAIVGAASEVSRRLELLITLRHLLYNSEESKNLREVDQLHPLVKDHVWLFGEEWRLTRSEVGLTTILREVLENEEIALEADLIRAGSELLLPEEKRGRVDLLLQRTLDESTQRQRLVVELKRPAVTLGERELSQIKRYARRLAGHPGVGGCKWTFWLVGTDTGRDIEADLNPEDRVWGHVIKTERYDVRVTTWSALINEAERRLWFYQDQLQYDIRHDEAVGRVRARHAELLEREPRRRPLSTE